MKTIITITYDEEKKYLNVESNIEKDNKGMEKLKKMIFKAGEILEKEK